MRFYLFCITVIFSGVIFWPFTSQSSSIDSGKLQLQDVIRLYIDHSPLFKSLEAKKKVASRQVDVARAALFPDLALKSSVTSQKVSKTLTGGLDISPKKIYDVGIEFKQSIYLGGKVWRGLQMRKIQNHLAQYQFLDVKQKALAKVIRSAINLVAFEEQRQVVLSSQDIQKRFVSLTKNRRRKGIARAYELDQSESDYLAYAPKLENLHQLIQSLVVELKMLLGLSLEAKLKIHMISDISSSEMYKKWIQLREFNLKTAESALKQRSDYQKVLLEVELAQVQKMFDLGDDFPSLVLLGNMGYRSPDRKDMFKTIGESHSLTLSLTVPFFSGLSSFHTRKIGEQNIYAAEKERRQLKDDIVSSVRQSEIQVSSALKQWTQSQKWDLQAEKALNSGLKSYRLGTIGYWQIVQLRASSERAALTWNDAGKNFRLTLLAWALAMGQDLETLYE